MRIRLPFAGAFLFLVLLAGYAGLTSIQVDAVINDKVLHTITFFLLTVVFYWILDTSRRRNLNFTLIVCTGILGVGSEFLQGFLPNGRTFDFYDIVANIVGSVAGLALCSWYHLHEEVDNWDENLEDAWDEDEQAGKLDSAKDEGLKTPGASSAGEVEGDSKKRAD
ncbi:hypothetical protein DID88_001726 [Monilinia fructigena]|uniref:VanZ-like domain-containing protein n=1 Tax=Monilinia fructigena TaxID=38457 RepID=A0A395IXT5_9HELO|nr:hypothetical protein DID88_001726 [Monilinia fructigena]